MKHIIDIWVNENCVCCKEVEAIIIEQGHEMNIHNASDMLNGFDNNVEAMAQLQMQGGSVLPVVLVDGVAIDGSTRAKFTAYIQALDSRLDEGA